MIDTDKYEGHLASEGQTWAWSKWMLKNAETIEQHKATSALLNDAPKLLAEVKRLRKEVKVLSKYRDIVIEFDDALLADGDTDIRWSAIYDERVFE
jgi:hypothetical protein